MTKADIVENIYEKVGLSKEESARIVELVLELLKETLVEGERIQDFRVREFRCTPKTFPTRKKSSDRRRN